MVTSQCLYNNNDRTPGAGARLAYSFRITAANNSRLTHGPQKLCNRRRRTITFLTPEMLSFNLVHNI